MPDPATDPPANVTPSTLDGEADTNTARGQASTAADAAPTPSRAADTLAEPITVEREAPLPAETVTLARGRDKEPRPTPDTPITLGRLQSSQDVATLFDVAHSTMLYHFYEGRDDHRYTEFEIPKRTGGVRTISAPVGLTRELQTKLAPLLAVVYQPHPAAHGFISGRSIVSNASEHADPHLLLNVDLKDFFPSINFGRIRGLFMAHPFLMGRAAAAVMAQICCFRNGLPQGAPTSPVLSNFIASDLDRRLTRLARNMRMHYSRYADDITFSTKAPAFSPAILVMEDQGRANGIVRCGPVLSEAIKAAGFTINDGKVRLQRRHVRQSVTGLTVNTRVNVGRQRIRQLRAMLHAWRKFGLDNAARTHFEKHGGQGRTRNRVGEGKAFRSVVYGQLAYIKMVRGPEDPVFLNLCAQLINLDPNPSRFIRQMVFGADDYEIFISHASEDKATIARPIFEACQKLGLKAFLDEAHIGWGDSFTTKINNALGAARTVLIVVSSHSVSKPWPIAEINTALSLEVTGEKRVLPVMVGTPDLSKLPLLRERDHVVWSGDPMLVARELKAMLHPEPPKPAAEPPKPAAAPPKATLAPPIVIMPMDRPVPVRRSWLARLFGKK
jgi:RNA-directed DNA polymerase